jgi:hypothetical protein
MPLPVPEKPARRTLPIDVLLDVGDLFQLAGVTQAMHEA